jgi:putative ABC transport system ATP-binding protein
VNPLLVHGVRVTYGDVVALHDIDLEVAPGTLLAVTGPSGAGKSSLLWAMAGALVPSAGTVRLGDVAIRDREQATGLGVVLAPQGNALATALTSYENVLVPMLAAGVPPAEAAERTRAALEQVGLEESGNHLTEELSGGQQQRVALARAFAARATVLLADEPTSDLDSGNRERMIAGLRDEARRGAVDPEAALQADAEVTLDEGAMTWVRRG